MNELLSEARAQVSGAALAALDAEVAQLRKVLALMKPHDVRACDLAPGFVRELGLDPQASVFSETLLLVSPAFSGWTEDESSSSAKARD